MSSFIKYISARNPIKEEFKQKRKREGENRIIKYFQQNVTNILLTREGTKIPKREGRTNSAETSGWKRVMDRLVT